MRQAKKEEWMRTLNDWKQSGLSQTQYCKNNNIKRDLFSYYKGQLMPRAKNTPPTKDKEPAFTKVVITPSKQPPTALQITLPNGAVISGIHKESLSLVNALMEALS